MATIPSVLFYKNSPADPIKSLVFGKSKGKSSPLRMQILEDGVNKSLKKPADFA